MIAIALGMSVISSVLLGYLATYSGSVSTLANSKLNQEMTTLMNLMVEDIRRAGYNGSAIVVPANNPYNQFDNTALEVFNDITNNIQQLPPAGTGSCIVYSYDLDDSGGSPTAAELFGFRRNPLTGVVQMRKDGLPTDADTCGDTTTHWESVTDPGFMNVTNLSFNLGSSACLNTSEPDGEEDGGSGGTEDDAPEFDCYVTTPDSGNITVETREILITLTANLADDAFVEITKQQSLRVRNDLVRIIP